MRQILAALCGIHGLCHLAGLTTGRMYPVWIALAASFLVAAHGINGRAPWWLAWTIVTALASVAACIAAGPPAYLGIFVNAAIVLAACVVFRNPGQLRNEELENLWRRASKAVRLQMHGEIKIGRWYPFHAEQVITADDGMVWAAQVRLFGLPVIGADRYVQGVGAMSWKLLGLLPIASGAGADVTRSAKDRWMAERSVWLPEPATPPAKRSLFRRWGNPDNTVYREVDFNVSVDEIRTVDGFAIPVRYRAGWGVAGGEFFRAAIDDTEYKR